ncbi:lipopolysaccharide biosynthesis protein [Arthrobacter sp. HLT1-20]
MSVDRKGTASGEEQSLASQPRFEGATAVQGVRWSLLAVLSRQGLQILSALVLARILGPSSYGVISAASIYVTFVSLLLDQGLSSALIQRPTLTRAMPGAATTLNVTMSLALAAATWFLAPVLSDFFHAPELAPVLLLLGLGLPLKALAITPRSMLTRELRFVGVAWADIVGAACGAVAGIVAALWGASYFAIVFQVVATDLLTAIIVLAAARGPLPNFHFKSLGPLLSFSAHVLATNFLAYFSRNIDNILVGRYLGLTSLSLYGMAYRILVVPVQLLGQTVNRVMFPAFSRMAQDRALVAENLLKSTRILAFAVIPVMSAVAVAAPELVHVVLGDQWLPAAPLITVLAIGGARETIFYITPTLMKGMGHAKMNFLYEILAGLVQVGGIVIGLQFGILGVALGLTTAGFLLAPVLFIIQRKMCGIRIRSQLRALLPALHASLWGVLAYFAVSLLPLQDPLIILLGFLAFAAVATAVFLLFHRTATRWVLSQLHVLIRKPKANSN